MTGQIGGHAVKKCRPLRHRSSIAKDMQSHHAKAHHQKLDSHKRPQHPQIVARQKIASRLHGHSISFIISPNSLQSTRTNSL